MIKKEASNDMETDTGDTGNDTGEFATGRTTGMGFDYEPLLYTRDLVEKGIDRGPPIAL